MAIELAALVQRVFLDVTQVTRGQQRASASVDQLERDVRDLGDQTDETSGKLGGLGKAADETGRRTQRLRKETNETTKSVSALGIATRDTAGRANDAGTSFKRFGDGVNIFGERTDVATRRMEALNAIMTRTGQTQDQAARSMQKLGEAYMGTSRAAIAVERAEARLAAARERLNRVGGDEDARASAMRRVEEAELSLAMAHERRASSVSRVTQMELDLGRAEDDHVRRQRDLNKENDRGVFGTNLLANAVGGLARAARGGSGGVTGLAGAFSMMKMPAIILGINMAVSALVALSGAVYAVIAALGPMVGLLGAIPGAVFGFAAAFGVVKTSFSGIGDAIKGYTTDQQSAAKTTATTAKQQETAARRVEDAQRAVARATDSATEQVRNAEERVTDARENAAEAAERAAERIKNANEQAADSEERLAEAIEDVAERNEDAQERVADARERLAETYERTQESVERANERVEDAEDAVADAQRRARDAQEQLNDARREASEQLEDLAFSAEGAAISEERAQLRLLDAQENYRRVMSSRRATDRERQEALLDLREAELGVKEAEDRREDSAKALDEANRKGVEGSDLVQNAIQNQKDANDSLADAQENLADARKDAAKAEVDAAKQVADAQKGLAEAQKDRVKAEQDGNKAIAEAQKQVAKAYENVAQVNKDANKAVAEANERVAQSERDLERTRRDAAENVADAQRNLAEAIKDMTDRQAEAAGGASKFQEAMKNLSPDAQAVVGQIIKLKEEFKGVQAAGAAGFLPGVVEVIKSVRGLLPELTQIFKDTGSALGGIATEAGKLVADPAFGRDLVTIGRNNALALQTLGGAASGPNGVATGLMGLVQGFKNVAVAAAPLVQWIAQLGNRFGEWFAQLTTGEAAQERMRRFFERAIEVSSQFGRIIRNLGRIFYDWGRAASGTGQDLLTRFEMLTVKWRTWTSSFEGQNRLKEFFESTKAPMEAMGRLIGDLVKGLGAMSNPAGLAPLIDQLRVEVLPPLLDIFNTVDEGFGPRLITALAQVLEIFSKLVGTSGPFNAFMDTLIRFLDALNWGIDNIPGFRDLFFIISTGLGSMAAFKFVGSPFLKLAGDLKGTTGLVGGLGQAFGLVTIGADKTVKDIEGPMAKLGQKIGTGIKSGISSAKGAITTAATAVITPLATALAPAFAAVQTAAAGMWAAITGPVGLVVLAIAAVVAALTAAYFHIKPFREFIDSIWQAIQAGWDRYVMPVLEALGGFFIDVFGKAFGFVKDTWTNVLQPTFEAIRWFAMEVLWPAIKIAFGFISGVVAETFEAIRGVWTYLLKPVFNAISAVVQFLYEQVVKRYFGLIKWEIETVFGAIGWAWEHILKPVWGAIETAIGWLWHNVVERAFSGIQTAISTVFEGIRTVWNNILSPVLGALRTAFEWIRDVGAGIWNTLASAIGGAFNGVVTVVRNSIGPVARLLATFIGAVAGILDAVGLDRPAGWLRTAETSLRNFAEGRARGGTVPAGATATPAFAAGGRVYDERNTKKVKVGPGFVTEGVRAIVGEGNPNWPEFVIPTDPRYRGRAVDLYAMLGRQLRLFEEGGQLPGYGLGVPQVIKDIGGAIGGGASWLVGGAIDIAKTGLGELASLGSGAWKAASGLIRRGAAAALERVWPVINFRGPAIPGIIPGALNSLRSSAVGWIRGREEKPGAAAGMVLGRAGLGQGVRGARGGRSGGRSRGRVAGLGAGGLVPGLQTGGTVSADALRGVILDLRVVIGNAFDAFASVVAAALDQVRVGLGSIVVKTEHIRVGLIDAWTKIITQLDTDAAALRTHLTTVTGQVTAGLTTLGTNLGTDLATLGTNLAVKLDTWWAAAWTTVSTYLTEKLDPLKASVDTINTTLATINTAVTGVGTSVGTLPAAIDAAPNMAALPGAVSQVAPQTVAGMVPSIAPIAPAVSAVAPTVAASTLTAAPAGGSMPVFAPAPLATTASSTVPIRPEGAYLPVGDQPIIEVLRDGKIVTETELYGGAPGWWDQWLAKAAAANQKAQEGWTRVGGQEGIRGTGGVHLAASGGFTTRMPTLVGEGSATHPEFIIPTDPRYHRNAVQLFSALSDELGIPSFANGGVVGGGRELAAAVRGADRLVAASRAGGGDTDRLLRELIALNRAQLDAIRRQGGRGGVVFEQGAVQVQERQTAETLVQKMQVLAAVGAFSGGGS